MYGAAQFGKLLLQQQPCRCARAEDGVDVVSFLSRNLRQVEQGGDPAATADQQQRAV
jgi:hypothetical protein